MGDVTGTDLTQFRDYIEAASRIVFFTGAGVSTESGIPDFRSPGGIWTRFQPIDFAEFMASREARREAWRRKFETDKTLSIAKPNDGHAAIAKLVRQGKASCVITQNIDGLHQASGVPDEQVIELHGNTTYAHCLGCRQRYELDPIREQFERDGEPPDCHCGGYVKTATVSFGQVDAGGGDGARRGGNERLRPVRGRRLVPGCLSRRRFSRPRQAARRPLW